MTTQPAHSDAFSRDRTSRGGHLAYLSVLCIGVRSWNRIRVNPNWSKSKAVLLCPSAKATPFVPFVRDSQSRPCQLRIKSCARHPCQLHIWSKRASSPLHRELAMRKVIAFPRTCMERVDSHHRSPNSLKPRKSQLLRCNFFSCLFRRCD